MTLFTLVKTALPAKVFVPVKLFVPFSRAMLAESWASETFPIKLVAVVAVVALAALPLMLTAAVPALRFAGFKPVNPPPLP